MRVVGGARFVTRAFAERRRRRGHRGFGTGRGDSEQRLVALRVPVGRRDHDQNVGGGGGRRRAVTVVRLLQLRGRGHRGRGGGRVVRYSHRPAAAAAVVHGLSEFGGAGQRRVPVVDGRVPETGLQVPGHAVPAPLARVTAQRLAERPPVLHRHQVVQDRVDRGRDVVEAARDRVQQLVDLRVVRRRLCVQVQQPLRVERSPAQEERHHYGRYNGNHKNKPKLCNAKNGTNYYYDQMPLSCKKNINCELSNEKKLAYKWLFSELSINFNIEVRIVDCKFNFML